MARQEELAHEGMGKMAAEWHRVGLERPHFCTRFRGQSESWVAPAQQENSFGARRENLGETGAEGKDYTLHLRLHLFLHPVERAISLRSVACRRQCNQKSPWGKNQNGRERPHPLTHGASRLPWGRSRPHTNFVSAFYSVAYTDPRICQTRGLTICMKTKGEARCLY